MAPTCWWQEHRRRQRCRYGTRHRVVSARDKAEGGPAGRRGDGYSFRSSRWRWTSSVNRHIRRASSSCSAAGRSASTVVSRGRHQSLEWVRDRWTCELRLWAEGRITRSRSRRRCSGSTTTRPRTTRRARRRARTCTSSRNRSAKRSAPTSPSTWPSSWRCLSARCRRPRSPGSAPRRAGEPGRPGLRARQRHPPDAERFFAQRMKATTEEINGSHCAFIAQPVAVANFIKKALTD